MPIPRLNLTGKRIFITALCCLLVRPATATSSVLDYVQQSLTVNGEEQVVNVPAGYRLEILVTKLEGPRLLTFGEEGELFIGSKSGRIYRLRPPYTRPEVLLKLKGYPHSVARRHGELLIARTDGPVPNQLPAGAK